VGTRGCDVGCALAHRSAGRVRFGA
jgi:hypothetical protein